MSDLGKIIVIPEKERLPLAVDRGRPGADVFLEIGFGNGEFLAALASERGDAQFWGVEMSRSCLMRACRRVEKANLTNVFLVSGDARFILKQCLPSCSLAGIYMNFPCPWPKKKHAKRRVSVGEFPSEIAAVLKRGGFFELATDEEWYGEEVREALSLHPTLSLSSWEISPPRKVTTKYERKWLAMGKRIFLSRFTKNQENCPIKYSMSGRVDDVHVQIPGKYDLNLFLQNLRNTEGQREGALWVYKGHYVAADGVCLIEVVTADGPFEQKFFVQMIQREDGVLIKISPYSTPFLTDGVKGALEHIGLKLSQPGKGGRGE